MSIKSYKAMGHASWKGPSSPTVTQVNDCSNLP